MDDPHHNFRIAGAALRALASALYMCCIVFGATWYRFFGAGERMARLAIAGSWYPQESTHSIMLRITNVDDHFARARSAGIAIVSTPTTHSHGERQYVASDVGGHRWTFSETMEEVDPSHWGGELLLR